jgi:sec-independent protein translocase protein TatA
VNLPGGWELVLVLLVVLVLFGSKRLPDSARALGRSLRIFKAETKGLRGDDAPEDQPRFDPMTGKPLEPPTGSETPR